MVMTNMALKSPELTDLSLKELVSMDLTERNINKLHPKIRLEFCIIKLKNENKLSSVSERQDAIMLLGELYYKLKHGQYNSEFTSEEKINIYSRISEVFKWGVYNELNCVPHHELSYQIAIRDMRELIPEMVWAALFHKSVVSRHEYIENLSNIAAWPELKYIMLSTLNDPLDDIKETAEFSQDRMRRYQNEPPLGFIDIV